MASIFDQYEQASQRTSQGSRPALATPPAASGYVTVPLADHSPIFAKENMDFIPTDRITHAVVSNDYLVLALGDGDLVRRDLSQPNNTDKINYKKFTNSSSRLANMFLDPLGQHLLLAFVSCNRNDVAPELFYLHRSSTKLRPVTKSRNYEVTEVGWNHENAYTLTTAPILLGTAQGHILESEFQLESDKMYQTAWRHVFEIGGGTDTPITGIEFHRVSKQSKYIIVVTTPNRLYSFVGHANPDDRPLLQPIFNSYLNIPETGFQEIPSSLKYSKLRFSYDKSRSPKTFAWLTEPGLFYGQLDTNAEQNTNALFTNGELLNYPKDSDTDAPPLSFVLTDFHALIMYANKVKAVCLLNQELVYEDTYAESRGKLKTIVKDPLKHTILGVTDRSVSRYKVVREERNVWRIYCDKRQFELAKEYCGDNPAHLDTISVRQAEILFGRGEYERSGSIYADTQSSFETICLKFLQVDQIDALKIYLAKRLEKLGEEEETPIAMIVVWMTELYLSQLGALRRKGQEESSAYVRLQSEFEIFLLQPRVRRCMKQVKEVIHDLICSHGDKHNFTKFTILHEDYQSVIAQHIQHKAYLDALEVLQTQKNPSLYYEFAPVLMKEVPKQTVNALIALGNKLSPSRLLSAFLFCDSDEAHKAEIVRYLEFMVQHHDARGEALHNYLLTLYADCDADALMRYLNRQGAELADVQFDAHYALRLCQDRGATKACVKLSALLGLWEDAVELALTLDERLAKGVADMPEDDDLRKKLWLKIAEHTISAEQDVGKAMGFLHECPLLKIEDVLPFFSDVVTIDHFRQPICQALQEYNAQIEDLKAEMDEAAQSAEKVRSEIQSFRNRSVIVSVSDICCLCETALLLRAFYLFPCGHKFHNDCLLAEVRPLLGQARRSKLEDIHRQLQTLSTRELTATTWSGLTLAEQLRSDADDIVAGECVYCGEHMIQTLDKPFIPDEDWERVAREWE